MSRLIPRGAVVAGLGKRFLAAVIDGLPFALLGALSWFGMRLSPEPTVVLVITIATIVLGLAYVLYQWWAYATRGAGFGAQLTGIRLVSLKDGEPVGWWRVFLRNLVFGALMGTIVGGIALLVFLVIHERRQGWHDMAAGSVVVQPKAAEARAAAAQKKVAQASTVGLPPHLSSSFSPQAGTTNYGAYAPPSAREVAQPSPPASAPDWLPGVQTEPVPPSAPPAPAQPVAQAPFNADAQWQPAPADAPAPQAPDQTRFGEPRFAPPPSPWQAPSAPSATTASSAASAPSAPEPPSAPVAPLPAPGPQWIPLPTPTSVIEPSVKVRPRDFGEVEDNDGTRIAHPARQAGRSGDEGWYLRLDDGREVELNVTVLLGRNPQKAPGDPEVHLVPASGDGRMISRTHVLIGTDPRGVFVVDRGSTNGTALVTTAGQLEPCPEGTQVRVREGQQVSYGNRWFTVLRRPADVG